MSDPLSQAFAALADPTRRDLVARLTDAEGHRSPVHLEAEVFDLMTKWSSVTGSGPRPGTGGWTPCWQGWTATRRPGTARDGMEVGVDQGYAKLDALLAAGEIAGAAEGAQA